MSSYIPKRLVILDIDGLRADVFQRALNENALPNLARILGGSQFQTGIQFETISTAPSITYCCQASSFTGAHPRDHWVAGNQFFDRFGRTNNGKPRYYAFDVEDILGVFLEGLAGKTLNPDVKTIYETAAEHGLTSTVAFHMYARGAQHWLKPGPEDWLDFASFRKLGVSESYDNAMLNDVIQHLQEGNRPDILTLYFWGLDHEAHTEGPAVQFSYLTQVIDRQIGRFLEVYEQLGLMQDTLFAIFSDHGQTAVQKDDKHSLKIGFLFDRELGYVFKNLGLDINDHLFEGENCNAILTLNGGMSHVYLRRSGGAWHEPPRMIGDVYPVARAFWEANQTGAHYEDLYNALDLILVRDVERDGWYAEYQVYTPEKLIPISQYLALHPEIQTVEAYLRLHYLSSPSSGDMILIPNVREGFYFLGVEYAGIHGGLHPEESRAVLAFGIPNATPEHTRLVCENIKQAIARRCAYEGNRHTSIADMAYGLRAAMNWL